MKKVIAIVGPTGTGKTDLGILLAKKFNGEIISGDSVQVYRFLNIGSAKVKSEEMDGIIHYQIDILDPVEKYSVYDFQTACRQLIDDITSRGKLPIIVGGTGFYIKAALFDYQFTSNGRNDEFDVLSNEELYIKLKELGDPEIPDVNNRRRLLRHMEIYNEGNIIINKDKPLYDYLLIGLQAERTFLYERANRRVDKMFEDGLLDEVTDLYQKYEAGIVHEAIGYKEFEEYFTNNKTLDEVKEQIKKHTRNFIKRQITWFKNQMKVAWIDVKKDDIIKISCKLVEEKIKK